MSIEAASLQRIESLLHQLIEDVSAPPRNGQPGGLLTRMKETEDDRAELRRLIEQMRRRLDALEAAPGKAALSWWDRVGLALLGITISGIAGLIGAQLGRSTPAGT